jgi:glycosyltransferase involved in cell wall biosynthesis
MNSGMIKLSIITVNLNNCVGLLRTIDSVINQTFKDFEFIIIDGGSTDGSIDLIKKHSEGITKWTSEPDHGIYNAMNKGIRIARGEYLLFLNSGDWLCSNSTLKEAFNLEFRQDILYGDRIIWDQNQAGARTIYPDNLSFSFFFRNTLGHQSTFIKRQLFEKFSYYNEAKKYDSDWEFFMLCLFKNNCTYKHIQLVICFYDLSGISSKSENWTEMLNERENTVKTNFPLLYEDYSELIRLRELADYHFKRNYYQIIRDCVKSIIKKTID